MKMVDDTNKEAVTNTPNAIPACPRCGGARTIETFREGRFYLCTTCRQNSVQWKEPVDAQAP